MIGSFLFRRLGDPRNPFSLSVRTTFSMEAFLLVVGVEIYILTREGRQYVGLAKFCKSLDVSLAPVGEPPYIGDSSSGSNGLRGLGRESVWLLLSELFLALALRGSNAVA